MGSYVFVHYSVPTAWNSARHLIGTQWIIKQQLKLLIMKTLKCGSMFMMGQNILHKIRR